MKTRTTYWNGGYNRIKEPPNTGWKDSLMNQVLLEQEVQLGMGHKPNLGYSGRFQFSTWNL